MILIDSNIPMYLVGTSHPHKSDAQRWLEKLVSDRERLVTDAEVLQEILHRYVAIDRRDAIQPAFEALLGIVDQVLGIDRVAVERAKEIVLGREGLGIVICDPANRRADREGDRDHVVESGDEIDVTDRAASMAVETLERPKTIDDAGTDRTDQDPVHLEKT